MKALWHDLVNRWSRNFCDNKPGFDAQFAGACPLRYACLTCQDWSLAPSATGRRSPLFSPWIRSPRGWMSAAGTAMAKRVLEELHAWTSRTGAGFEDAFAVRGIWRAR